uniref:Uncharacterized protein n=1 Tax=Quercus lobata TaxID=97700 RepID=A0A7N2KKP4_QUELO
MIELQPFAIDMVGKDCFIDFDSCLVICQKGRDKLKVTGLAGLHNLQLPRQTKLLFTLSRAKSCVLEQLRTDPVKIYSNHKDRKSQDVNVETSQSLEAVYINSGDNPFELLKDSIKFHSTWTGLDGALGMLSTLKSVHNESKRVFKVNEFSKEGEPFIEGTHYLASCSVDGVKFDIQNLMETLGSGIGGWVSLTRFYEEALEQSIARNFKYNNLFLIEFGVFSLKESEVARASEDFMPREPTFQTLHIASVAFNSLLLGEIVVPDWDMAFLQCSGGLKPRELRNLKCLSFFIQSKHDTAEFHAAARAIGGCAAYVSDTAIIAIEMPHAAAKPIQTQHLDLAHLEPIRQAYLISKQYSSKSTNQTISKRASSICGEQCTSETLLRSRS